MIRMFLFKKQFIGCIILLLSFLQVNLSAQDQISNSESRITDPSIAVSLSSFVNLFPSINGAYEFYYAENETLEFELGYIYKSIMIEGAKGGIFKTTWKRTYKQKANNRFYIGIQQQLQADLIKGEAIYYSNDGSHYRFDDFTRHKYRLSVLGLVGRDISIYKWLHLSLNLNFGLQSVFVQINSQDIIEELYEPIQLGSVIVLNNHIPIMPDGGISVQLRFRL